MEKQKKTKGILQIWMGMISALFFMVPLTAQNPSYNYFDSLTYQLYADKQWSVLSEVGANAIDQGHDGFYIQLRTGIALFHSGRYRKASNYLTKSWEIFPNDVSAEYLYYSKLFGGRYLESEVMREKLPQGVQEYLGLSNSSVIKSVGISGALFFPQKEISTANFELDVEGEGSYLLANTFSYYGFFVSHRFSKRCILNHQANILNKKSYLFSTSAEFDDVLRSDNYQTNQFNYYLKWDYSLGKNWRFHLFGNLFWLNFPLYKVSAVTDNNNVSWQQINTNDFDMVAGASLVKSFDLADVSLELAGSSIGNKNQFQSTGILLLYPLYNLNLYLEGQFSYTQSVSDKYFIIGALVGSRITRFLWLEASGTLAEEAHSFHSQQGSLVFNGSERINYMAGLNAILLPIKQLKLYLSWQQRSYTSYFVGSDVETQLQQPLNKNYQLISTSLLWTF